MLFGNWRQYGEPITHHDGFAPLAELLGQSHLNVRKGVRVDSLPLDQLWATILACADAINEHE